MHDTTEIPGRVTTAEARAMFEVSDQVWKSWKRKGWVPRGERTGKGPGKTYDRAELEAFGRDAQLSFPADDAGMKQAEQPRRAAA